MNYTKGEWIADNGDSEIWGVFSDIDADGIAYLCEPDGKLLRPFDEAKANAHLIAAAPEMHEALKHTKIVLRNLRVCNLGELTQHQELLEREIKLSLAKAEGGK